LGAAGFTAVVKSSISAASDLHEQLNKTDVVFGKSAKSVKEFAKTSATSLGLAEHQALGFAATFGNLLHPMGIARNAASKMSVTMVKLAADMASFNNADPTEVLQAIQSGISGQARPLRQFGIFLSEDRVKAEALSSGLVKANVSIRAVGEAQTAVAIATAKAAAAHKKYGEGTTQAAQADLALERAQDRLHKALEGTNVKLTDAQKGMARYQIIMKDSSDAQGDFARTSGGLANQQRILKAQITDLEAKLGTALMPTVLKITHAMTDWLGKTENQKKIQDDLNMVISTAGDVLKAMKGIVDTMSPAVKTLNSILGGTKHTLELLIGLGVAAKLRAMALAFGLGSGGVAAGATVATQRVGLLSKALAGLPSKILISIVMIPTVYGAGKKFFEEHFGADFSGVASDTQGKGGNPYPVGTYANKDWAAGYAGKPPPGGKANKEYKEGQAAKAAKGAGTAGSALQGAAVVSTAIQASQSPGSNAASFHLPGERTPYDCSAFTQAVFRKSGISIGSTTYSQYAGGRPVNKNDIQPGDLVFFNYPGERSPGHVGIATGGGMMVHDHGASRGVSNQGIDWGAYVGARCYIKSHVHAGARTGGGGTGGSAGAGGATGGTSGGLTVGTTKTAPKGWKGATAATIISAKASVQAMITDARKVIGGMAGPMDDIERAAIQHLEKLKAHLHPHMTPADLARTRAEIKKWGKVLSDEINEQTKRAKRAFDLAAKTMLRAFDKETELGLKARAAPDETPTEKVLRERSEARNAAQLQQALDEAIASGDAQAIADAEYDIQTAALEKQAAAERKAADEKAATDQEAYQQARDDQREALQQQLDDWNEWLTKKMKTWNQFWAWVRAHPNGGGVIPNIGEIATAPGPGSAPPKGGNAGWADAGDAGWVQVTGGRSTGGIGPPRMAVGGIVRRPTLAIIGESGPEAVVPLRRGVGGDTYNFHFPNYVGNEQDLAETVRREFLRIQNRSGGTGIRT
jgi:cell wall-associated NlpC family hydrolase